MAVIFSAGLGPEPLSRTNCSSASNQNAAPNRVAIAVISQPNAISRASMLLRSANRTDPHPIGAPGTLWFKSASNFQYFNDPVKTKEARSPDGTMSTVGDVGYVDADGYLYLTDRATFMIISGGVNIYPQECENLLITHPLVADAAVFGVPNADLGEEVKAVVQLMPAVAANRATACTWS